MEALYKPRKVGFADRNKRKELHKTSAKAKRDDLIALKRKMPLGELNGGCIKGEHTKPEKTKTALPTASPAKPKRKDKESKTNDRLQRLREWQLAREEAKAKANQVAKKPMFVLRKPKSTSSDVHAPRKTQPSFSAKKTVLCMSPKPARPVKSYNCKNSNNASKEETQKRKIPASSSSVTASTKPIVTSTCLKKKKLAEKEAVPARQLVRHSTRLATKKTASSTAKTVSSTTKEVPSKTATRSSKVATRSTSSVANSSKTTTRSSKPSSVANSSRAVTAKKVTKNGAPEKPISGKNSSNAENKRKPLGKVPTSETIKEEEDVEMSSVSPPVGEEKENSEKKSEDEDLPCVIPTTPIRKYEPVQPSPLLNSRSATEQRRDTSLIPRPLFVDDPAWVPGAVAPTESNGDPNFDEAFDKDSFSPFKFGSNSDPYQFSFHMDAKPLEMMEASSTPVPLNSNSPAGTPVPLDINAPSGTPVSGDINAPSGTPVSSDINAPSGTPVSGDINAPSGTPVSGDINTPSGTPVSGDINAPSGTPVSGDINAPSGTPVSVDINAPSGTPVAVDINAPSGTPVPLETNTPSDTSDIPVRSPQPPEVENDLAPHVLTATDHASDVTNEINSSPESKVAVTPVKTPRSARKSSRRKTRGSMSDEGKIDIAYFRTLYSDACEKLLQLCDSWERKAVILEQKDDSGIPDMEEVLGHVRTTTCQAHLLVNKKLKQYIGLVDIAENQSGDRPTTSEDLQGFWDMVYFQVEGLYKTFENLHEMDENDWKRPPSPKKAKVQKKRVKRGTQKSVGSEGNKESSERLRVAREKREAERARLRDLRGKAKQAKQEEQEKENEVQPSNDKMLLNENGTVEEIKMESDNQKEGGTPRKRAKKASTPRGDIVARKSMRLLNKSIFSPAPPLHPSRAYSNITLSSEGAPNSNVPTGQLISL